MLLVVGLLAVVMRRSGWPVAPAVIGLILGPVAETNLRRALAISDGDLSVLIESGFSKIVIVGVLAVLVGTLVLKMRSRRAELTSAGQTRG